MFKFYAVFFWILGVCASSVVATSARAAPALVVLIDNDNGDGNPVYRQFMEAFGYVVTTNQLGKKYDSVSILSGNRATGAELFSEIRKRSAKRWVDVVILSHGLPGKLDLALDKITREKIEKESPIAHLRMVYMMACHSSTLVQSWKKIGARSVIGHQDVNSLVPFFFPQFLAHWAQGVSIDDAALRAHRSAVKAARSLSPFVVDQNDYVSEVGIQKSYPIVMGENFNIEGIQENPSPFLRGIQVTLDAKAAIGESSNAPMKRAVLEMAGSLIPQVKFDSSRVRTSENLISVLKPALWENLLAAFPNSAPNSLSNPVMGRSTETESLWMDGDSLRLMTDPLREWAGGKFSTVMDRLQGIRLDTVSSLQAGIYLDRSVDFDLDGILNSDSQKKSLGRPLSLHFPKSTRLTVSLQDGVLKLHGFDRGVDAVIVRVAGPMGTEWKVWPRLVEFDLDSGKLRIQVAVIGNSLSLWAEGDVMAKKFSGFSFWDSVESNLPIFEWPTLRFLPMNIAANGALDVLIERGNQ